MCLKLRVCPDLDFFPLKFAGYSIHIQPEFFPFIGVWNEPLISLSSYKELVN